MVLFSMQSFCKLFIPNEVITQSQFEFLEIECMKTTSGIIKNISTYLRYSIYNFFSYKNNCKVHLQKLLSNFSWQIEYMANSTLMDRHVI